MKDNIKNYNYPDSSGHFEEFGGKYVPETLIPVLDELEKHYTLKIYLFVKIAPQKFRLENQGARDVIVRKSIFSSRSPLRNFVLNISTSPPTARSAENV